MPETAGHDSPNQAETPKIESIDLSHLDENQLLLRKQELLKFLDDETWDDEAEKATVEAKIHQQLALIEKALAQKILHQKRKKGESLSLEQWEVLIDDLVGNAWESAIGKMKLKQWGFKNYADFCEKTGTAVNSERVADALPEGEDVEKVSSGYRSQFWKRVRKNAIVSGAITASAVGVTTVLSGGLIALPAIAMAGAGSFAGGNIARALADRFYRERRIYQANEGSESIIMMVKQRLIENMAKLLGIAGELKGGEQLPSEKKAELINKIIDVIKSNDDDIQNEYKKISRKAFWLELGLGVAGSVAGGAAAHALHSAIETKQKIASWARDGVRGWHGASGHEALQLAPTQEHGHIIKETTDNAYRFVIENKDIGTATREATHHGIKGADYGQIYHGATSSGPFTTDLAQEVPRQLVNGAVPVGEGKELFHVGTTFAASEMKNMAAGVVMREAMAGIAAGTAGNIVGFTLATDKPGERFSVDREQTNQANKDMNRVSSAVHIPINGASGSGGGGGGGDSSTPTTETSRTTSDSGLPSSDSAETADRAVIITGDTVRVAGKKRGKEVIYLDNAGNEANGIIEYTSVNELAQGRKVIIPLVHLLELNEYGEVVATDLPVVRINGKIIALEPDLLDKIKEKYKGKNLKNASIVFEAIENNTGDAGESNYSLRMVDINDSTEIPAENTDASNVADTSAESEKEQKANEEKINKFNEINFVLSYHKAQKEKQEDGAVYFTCSELKNGDKVDVPLYPEMFNDEEVDFSTTPILINNINTSVRFPNRQKLNKIIEDIKTSTHENPYHLQLVASKMITDKEGNCVVLYDLDEKADNSEAPQVADITTEKGDSAGPLEPNDKGEYVSNKEVKVGEQFDVVLNITKKRMNVNQTPISRIKDIITRKKADQGQEYYALPYIMINGVTLVPINPILQDAKLDSSVGIHERGKIKASITVNELNRLAGKYIVNTESIQAWGDIDTPAFLRRSAGPTETYGPPAPHPAFQPLEPAESARIPELSDYIPSLRKEGADTKVADDGNAELGIGNTDAPPAEKPREVKTEDGQLSEGDKEWNEIVEGQEHLIDADVTVHPLNPTHSQVTYTAEWSRTLPVRVNIVGIYYDNNVKNMLVTYQKHKHEGLKLKVSVFDKAFALKTEDTEPIIHVSLVDVVDSSGQHYEEPSANNATQVDIAGKDISPNVEKGDSPRPPERPPEVKPAGVVVPDVPQTVANQEKKPQELVEDVDKKDYLDEYIASAMAFVADNKSNKILNGLKRKEEKFIRSIQMQRGYAITNFTAEQFALARKVFDEKGPSVHERYEALHKLEGILQNSLEKSSPTEILEITPPADTKIEDL